jgi:hypothetical protein
LLHGPGDTSVFQFHSLTLNFIDDSIYLPLREEDEEDAPEGFAQIPPLLKLLKCRGSEVEKCNMLLLLLVAGLEFSLPLSLIDETLHTANLDIIGGVNCVTLLQLPHEDLLLTASILLRLLFLLISIPLVSRTRGYKFQNRIYLEYFELNTEAEHFHLIQSSGVYSLHLFHMNPFQNQFLFVLCREMLSPE